MPRRLPPPDFRYVGLWPGSTPAALAIFAGTAGAAAASLGLWNAGHEPLSLVLSLGASALGALSFARSRRGVSSSGAREVAMAIVPWGVVVTPDTEPRVLRWPAIRRVTVETTHTLRGGTPAVVASLVRVRTDGEVFAGRTLGAVDLERLMANLEGYAEEASRPVAVDLDGAQAEGGGATEPLVESLLARAEELCSTADGACRLHLPARDYRSVAARVAPPETVEEIRATLGLGLETPADARPLAGLLAGLLGARELVPDLVRLVSCPHPLVAAVAKAAALRLGAPPNRAGAVDEVRAFLFEEDFELLTRWAARSI